MGEGSGGLNVAGALLLTMLTEAELKKAERAAVELAIKDYDVDLILGMDDDAIRGLACSDLSSGDAERIVKCKRKRAT